MAIRFMTKVKVKLIVTTINIMFPVMALLLFTRLFLWLLIFTDVVAVLVIIIDIGLSIVWLRLLLKL